jgi:Zn-dependent M28 family amino/carboxypeptidase
MFADPPPLSAMNPRAGSVSRRRFGTCASVAALLLSACGGGSDPVADREGAMAVSSATTCAKQKNDSFDKLLECVTLAGVREHQAELQAIADANGGTRAAGTPGYDASVAFVVERMTAAGYLVTLDEFPFVFVPPPLLRQLTPVSAIYETGAFTNTGFGNVTAAVTAVDVNLVPPRASTSGCDGAFTEAAVGEPIVPDPAGPDDFAVFVPGSIALVQRGGCSFALKVANAQAAGASAVIIFNQGNTPDREGQIVGTVAPVVATIPVVGASFVNGEALAQAGSTATVRVDPPQNITQVNVLAESRDGDPNNVVMVGAHLDSVQRGPGINDNGSGSAAILEVAEQMARAKPRNKLRFAWWGGEESGLIGSTAYVDGLAQAEIDRIALYLNFDMVGSPNHVFFIYDGDNSDAIGAGAGPEGSAQIEKTFERFYTQRGIPFKGTDFSGRSDYGPFIAAGIPSGGLFTGAEGIKSAEEVTLWGGTAGAQYDPCYHLACDTFANNSDGALDVNADAVAYATLQYAMNTQDVNAVRGKGNFKLVVPYPRAAD